jgi:hypothetical protein
VQAKKNGAFTPLVNEHANVDPASELNANDGVLSSETASGAWVIVVVGPAESIVKACVLGSPVFPARSVARTLNV